MLEDGCMCCFSFKLYLAELLSTPFTSCHSKLSKPILSYHFGVVYCSRIKIFLWFGDMVFYVNNVVNTKFKRILLLCKQQQVMQGCKTPMPVIPWPTDIVTIIMHSKRRFVYASAY